MRAERRKSPPRASGGAGFTLLELLVALAIAGLAFAALARGTGQGLQAGRIAGQYEEALARARSRLDAVGRAVALIPGEAAGEDGGGYRWHLRVAPLAVARPGEAGLPPVALYAVAVTVSWDGTDGDRGGGPRAVRLETRRLGPAPPRSPP